MIKFNNRIAIASLPLRYQVGIDDRVKKAQAHNAAMYRASIILTRGKNALTVVMQLLHERQLLINAMNGRIKNGLGNNTNTA